MSKKQLDVTHNERVAYTAGWVARSDNGKKGDSPFNRKSRLGELWLQGFKDQRKGTKNKHLFRQEAMCEDELL